MDANGVVIMLNELEAAGYSIRRRDPQDRRRDMVEVTAARGRAVQRADKARESLEDEASPTSHPRSARRSVDSFSGC